MRRKICIITILIILSIMVFILTGCGNNKSADNQPNNINTYNATNEEAAKNDINNNVLLGKWSGKDSINRDSTWEFQKDKVIFSQYYDYIDESFSWEGTYKIVDDNTVIIKIKEWESEKEFNYEITDGKYLTLINMTEEQQYAGFPDFKNLEKSEK